MKKLQLKKELNNIEKLILNYFNDREFPSDFRLKILDYDSRRIFGNIRCEYSYSKEYYTGVTIKYLKTYLLNNKYKKDMIVFVLMKLLKKYQIRSLRCGNIGSIVFESCQSEHHSVEFNDYQDNIRIKKTDDYKYGSSDMQYIQFIKTYNSINSQIN